MKTDDDITQNIPEHSTFNIQKHSWNFLGIFLFLGIFWEFSWKYQIIRTIIEQ